MPKISLWRVFVNSKNFTKLYASVSLKIYFWHESSLKLFLFTPRMYLEGLTYHVNSWVVIKQRLLEQISNKTWKTHRKLNFRGSLGRGEMYQFHNNLSLRFTKSEFGARRVLQNGLWIPGTCSECTTCPTTNWVCEIRSQLNSYLTWNLKNSSIDGFSRITMVEEKYGKFIEISPATPPKLSLGHKERFKIIFWYRERFQGVQLPLQQT